MWRSCGRPVVHFDFSPDSCCSSSSSVSCISLHFVLNLTVYLLTSGDLWLDVTSKCTVNKAAAIRDASFTCCCSTSTRPGVFLHCHHRRAPLSPPIDVSNCARLSPEKASNDPWRRPVWRTGSDVSSERCFGLQEDEGMKRPTRLNVFALPIVWSDRKSDLEME